MKTKRIRSYYAVIHAMPGFLLYGGAPRVRSSRFRMKRDAENWLDAMMSQPFAGEGKVFSSAISPDCNALTR